MADGKMAAMNAQDMILEHAPHWTDEQARRALDAAESSRPSQREDRIAAHRALMQEAAALRARQSKQSDVVALVHEARDELEQRSS
jgi:chemotaxis regulatin CheY-phosphate phosphatase CheZ